MTGEVVGAELMQALVTRLLWPLSRWRRWVHSWAVPPPFDLPFRFESVQLLQRRRWDILSLRWASFLLLGILR